MFTAHAAPGAVSDRRSADEPTFNVEAICAVQVTLRMRSFPGGLTPACLRFTS
jgi:hypothetical protein